MSIQPSVMRERARDKVRYAFLLNLVDSFKYLDTIPPEIISRAHARLEKAFDEYENIIATHERSIEERLSNLEKIFKKDFKR